jgi:hypothetical protein
LTGERLLIVEPTTPLEERTQSERVGGLGEKEQRLDVEVLDALARHAEALSDLGEGLWGQAAEAVVGGDDLPQARREHAEQAGELGVDLTTVESLGDVGGIDRQDEKSVLECWQRGQRLVVGNRFPDGARDRDDGVGAEPGPSRRIVA